MDTRQILYFVKCVTLGFVIGAVIVFLLYEVMLKLGLFVDYD